MPLYQISVSLENFGFREQIWPKLFEWQSFAKNKYQNHNKHVVMWGKNFSQCGKLQIVWPNCQQKYDWQKIWNK